MKARETNLLNLLKNTPQFIIPIYQRTYSWTEKQCEQLWNDIIDAGSDEKILSHFIGSIVYIESDLQQISSQSSYLIIDGQQRLTTCVLLLEALSRHLNNNEPLDGFSSKKIRNYYLLNPLEDNDMAFKLILTQLDKETLLTLLEQKPLPKDCSINIVNNFSFFDKKIKSLDGNLKAVCKGLSKLVIVDVALDRRQDNPQLIFESMNSTGKALSQADLIRNYILMDLDQKKQKYSYEQYWHPMETAFGQENYNNYFDSFMRHYLTMKTGKIPKIDDVYEEFKIYARKKKFASVTNELLLEDIKLFSDYYCAMALGREENKDLSLSFRNLRELKVDVVYPFLLELYDDYKSKILSYEDFLESLRLIESYLFRRSVCGLAANFLNKAFASFGKSLKKHKYLESIKAHLLQLTSQQRFPTDAEFKECFSTRDLYKFRNKNYWLRRLENFGRKECIFDEEYTIEHIMPQNKNLSIQWQKDLGPDWQVIQELWLHNAGNLTLTAYNSEFSDRPFLEKREMEGGFRHSPLWLNQGLGQVEVWNENEIKKRGKRLAERAATLWPYPFLKEDILKTYQKKNAAYSLDNFNSLTEGSFTRSLFDQLRKEILLIDPRVKEKICKIYIAYKAKTNFVDIEADSKKLRLCLNMKFEDLIDPKNMARDVTHIGHHGNGDVEILYNSPSELDDVMRLIRQSFERNS
ncbi:DUF262 and DUF1524 domain-containing protein [Aristophania vespae]|uniref:DUF262 and DUF1524 domain-containing protein n=1 Tax=Aristophania vespae TaxID=2697033 RepID=UPI00235194B0|nr:DUF262 and DUF1524 domain-containing protein [Aristophania vespae]UMM63247.1 hypothetical protein DM15PD_02050 [Aristophania vespae]